MEFFLALCLILGAWSLGLSSSTPNEPVVDESAQLATDVDTLDVSGDVSVCTATENRMVVRDLSVETSAQ